MNRQIGLKRGPLTPGSAHICVDMHTTSTSGLRSRSGMARALPAAEALALAWPSRTIFTRQVPRGSNQGLGANRQGSNTISALPNNLARLLPTAMLLEKDLPSPWETPALEERLRSARVDTLIFSGAEIDEGMLATLRGAVDRGYRVIIAVDALGGSEAELEERFLLADPDYADRVELSTIAEILRHWH
ncbi:isochorismatase family protein [Acetobacteraceae bacterium H6797]|nr:isochorismatase family protein [Acetobacteraceae bacterium H6797]